MVRELHVARLGYRHRANLLGVSGGFPHLVKVDVRLVSFPRLAFEMTWPQNHDLLHNVGLSTTVFSQCRAGGVGQEF